MNSQDIVNLEFLRRATSSDVPARERQDLQEALGYALATDQTAAKWILDVVYSLVGQNASDELVLWVVDWIESQPNEILDQRTSDALARLCSSTHSELVRTRLFDVLNKIEAESTTGKIDVESPLGFAISHELEGARSAERAEAVLPLIDLALSEQDSRLFDRLLSGIRAIESNRVFESLLRAEVVRRFNALNPRLQESVRQAFGF